MAHDFPTDLRRRLDARLEEGVYRNEDDLLRDALDALDQVEQETLARWNDRNRLAVEQSRRGLSKPLDGEQVLRRLRDRLAQEGIVD